MDTSYLRQYRYKPTCEIVSKYRGDREVVLFGDAEHLRTILKNEYDIETKLIATRVKAFESKENYYPLKHFKHKSKKYYIVVPTLSYDAKIVKTLNDLGYDEYKDFVFTLHRAIKLKTPVKGYSDEYGNKVDCPAPGLSIVLDPISGNNTVSIDASVKFAPDCVVRMQQTGGELHIGPKCRLGDDNKIIVSTMAKINIGQGVTIGGHGVIVGSMGSNITLGEDCMLSKEILMYSGDGHTIFDTEKMTRTNPIYPHNERFFIDIGPHVWIGYRSAILYQTKIGASSIVGTQSLVKGSFPNNCVLAGNPAKIVKKNVTWHRDPYETDIYKVDERYLELTHEDL